MSTHGEPESTRGANSLDAGAGPVGQPRTEGARDCRETVSMAPGEAGAAPSFSVDAPPTASWEGDSADEPRTVTSSPPPGAIGRYEVRGILGEGGFGRVYRAFDVELGRFVALKVPSPRIVATLQDVEI